MKLLDRRFALAGCRGVSAAVALWAMAAGHPAGRGSSAGFSAILGGSGQDYAASVAVDHQGNIYVAGLTYSPDFHVTAGALQPKLGGGYGSDAFVAKFAADGALLWSTYLGGSQDDWATGVAVDTAGNVLVTGWTRSADFPLAHAAQGTLNNGASLTDFDAFVAKLDPGGTRLLYATFLGGPNNDGAAGIALDAAGAAYVAVHVDSASGYPGAQDASGQFGIFVTKLDAQGGLAYSFFHPGGAAGAIAVDAAGSAYVTGSSPAVGPLSVNRTFGPLGNQCVILFQVSPDGSRKVFETAFGGSVWASGQSVALDGAGAVYVAGTTSSVDFPLVRPLQSTAGARPLWKSTDGGATWAPLDDLPFALPQVLAADPAAPDTLYMGTGDLGLFQSVDGGVTWSSAGKGIASSNVQRLTIDPVHPRTLYAATPFIGENKAGVYKSVDGANTWTLVDSPPVAPSALVVDPQNPDTVYEALSPPRVSMDGGATWNAVTFPGILQTLVLDPHASGGLFASSGLFFCGFFCTSNKSPSLYRSANGGADWTQITAVPALQPGLLIDGSTNPSTLYDGLAYRSVDGGATWTPLPTSPASSAGTVAVDPNGTLYAAVYGDSAYISRDHGETWTAMGSLGQVKTERIGASIASLVPAGSTGTVYAISSQTSTSGFVTKLSADGSSIIYSTYLSGHPSLDYYPLYLAEPSPFGSQTWIAAISVDGGGNAVVAGGTRSRDFATVTPAQGTNAGLADAFAAAISPDGSKLTYSTYFGGSQDDGALAAAVDRRGDLIFAGQTWSLDFPVAGGVQPPAGLGEAFVVKLPRGAVRGHHGRGDAP